jgi:hypothetical protein
MTEPVEDVSSLPGKTVHDQTGRRIGKIKNIYAQGDDGEAAWVTVEATGTVVGSKKSAFVPLARMKYEGEDLAVPYSANYVEDAPEIDSQDELSEADENRLRSYYGIGRGDQELRDDNKSYAAMTPEGDGTPQRVDDPNQVQAPNPDRRDEETQTRRTDPGSSETRHVTFDDQLGG